MIKYIDKAAIENILHKLWKTVKWYGSIDVARTSYNQALQEIQCELDALAIEEIDLDDEIHNYINTHYSEGCDGGMISDAHNDIGGVVYSDLASLAEHFYELGVRASNPTTAADRGTAEEIIINLKRVEKDYRIDLTREIEWLRNKVKKGE